METNGIRQGKSPMKNSHLPLIQALKNKLKPKEPFSPPEMPRAFELQHSELPGLSNKKVGEPISVNVSGHIHSQNADGHSVMHVASVKPDSGDMTKAENPEVRVRTQESNSP